MVQQREIFRKAALERLSSPEQLDRLMQVTRPRTWIALVGLVLLLAVVVVWGFVGSIPTKVQAQGVLIKPGGVFDVFANASGPIVELLIGEGDEVEPGQLLARVDQPDLRAQIQAARAELAEREKEHVTLVAVSTEGLGLRNDSLILQEAKLKDTIAFAEERLAALEQQIESQETLLEKGLITRHTVLQTRQDYFGTKDLAERSRNELQQIPLERLTARTGREQEIVRSQLGINEMRRRLEHLEAQHELRSTVLAPYRARILEVKKRRGDLIMSGAAVASLQRGDQTEEGLQAIIYVPPHAGKSVVSGLRAEISPTAVRREEFGYMIGEVTYVSEFPATAEGMMQVLRNEGLVQTLSAHGPPFAVYADLVRDPEAIGGYRWSSPKGAALRMNAGTICYVTLTVRARRPVEMVIPMLREYTGI